MMIKERKIFNDVILFMIINVIENINFGDAYPLIDLLIGIYKNINVVFGGIFTKIYS